VDIFQAVRDDFAVQRSIPVWKRPYHISINFLARVWLKLIFRGTIVAITGSVGKTTIKRLLKAALADLGPIATSDNLDPIFNIPHTMLRLRPGNKMLIVEMGVEYPGEMDYYLSLVRPNIAIITKISVTHTEFFKNRAGVFAEKIKIFNYLKKSDLAIVPNDEKDLVDLVKKQKGLKMLVGAGGEVAVTDFKQDIEGSTFNIVFQGKKYPVKLALVGKHNAYLAAIAFGVAMHLKVNPVKVILNLGSVEAPKNRLNILKTKKGFTIISDVYNSSPSAVIAAMDVLADIKTPGKKVVVFSDMLELGELEKVEHERLAQLFDKYGFDELALWGNSVKFTASAAKGNKRVKLFDSKTELVSYLSKNLGKSDVVLVKGSHGMKLSEVVTKLTLL